MAQDRPSYWVATLGASTRYYDVGGTRTRALEAGEGPPVVMLHGMGGHLENFVYNVVPLSQLAGRRVYAIDLLGHGMNSRDERTYNFAGMIDHVLGFMDVVGAERASIVGLSLGGLLGAWLAIRHPGRIDKLVLTTTFGLHLDGTDDAAVDNNFQRVRESNLRAMKTPTLDTVRDRLRPLAHDAAVISEEMVQTRHHIYTLAGTERVMTNFVGNLYDERWDCVLTNERLGRIGAETLVVWGEHNNPPVDYARRAVEAIPNARLHVCPNSGHWPHVEAEEEYNQTVARFLKGAG